MKGKSRPVFAIALAMMALLTACASQTTSDEALVGPSDSPQSTTSQAPAGSSASNPMPVATLTPSQLRPESPSPTSSLMNSPAGVSPSPKSLAAPAKPDDRAKNAKPKPKPSPTAAASNCDPNYANACVPVVAWDLDCGDIGELVIVVGQDIHGFDAEGDGRGCESYG